MDAEAKAATSVEEAENELEQVIHKLVVAKLKLAEIKHSKARVALKSASVGADLAYAEIKFANAEQELKEAQRDLYENPTQKQIQGALAMFNSSST